ncbi:LOW QUALITY PROTEIN: glucan endo-1,3-beta-glucosidase GV [Oryza sativa Japonica Group]|uniref:LOW QUALITY PROTEIN: glucan endo-1,3-beta-glucosidase GV n=1 Tax=Oryza sativa subsp. japonica TaxID=39947 RepID=UPI00339CCF18
MSIPFVLILSSLRLEIPSSVTIKASLQRCIFLHPDRVQVQQIKLVAAEDVYARRCSCACSGFGHCSLRLLSFSMRSIGVCYGMNGDGLPSRSNVVQLYKSNGIGAMRIYSADREALDALRGSGIDLALDVGERNDVGQLAANADSWVQDNVKAYYPDVKIKYIVVGNELTGTGDAASILPAMQNVQAALASAGLADSIKVTTAIKMDTLAASSPPSAGVFTNPSVMEPIVRFLTGNGAPLLANVYPYFAYRDSQDIDLSYALFQPSSTTVSDPNGGGLSYTNLFDAMVDAVRAAVEKVSGGGSSVVDVVVSESGWPSDGGKGATVENARAYNQNLIDHVAQGTPKKPGQMEVYVFALFNENRKEGDATEKKFGLFIQDKTPVYPITF